MAEKYELDRWAAVVCNGFTAVNVMSSGNVEELGWDYTEMELDPTGTCGLFDGNPAAARPLHVSPATISQAVRYGTPVAGLHFYHGDEPKPAPEFFKPIKPERGKSPMQMAAAARAAAGNPGRPDGGQRPRRAV